MIYLLKRMISQYYQMRGGSFKLPPPVSFSTIADYKEEEYPEINWDNSKPDGTPRKLIDSSKIRSYGWKPNYNLIDGIKLYL